jgi:folate-binding protein YgfZ
MTTTFSCLLANRGVLRLSGQDRRAFLQGLVSNDVSACVPGHAVYAALLTPQGKFLHDLFIVDTGDEFLIDCEAARAEDLLKRLAAYKLRAKVTLADAQDEYDVWAMRGQGSGFGVQGAFVDARLPELGMRAILRKGDSITLNPDPRSQNFDAYDRHRLKLGVTDGSRDMIVEKSTLADGNFDFLNGISWSKGCYLGQELTARMHYRGLVKKRMFPVTIEGGAPAFGTVITFNGEDIGDMRSSCDNLGLALLNIEKAEAAMREKVRLACGESGLAVSKSECMKDA